MKRKISLVESAMKHRQIVFLITGLLVLFGGYALYVMPRQEFPQFTIRQGLVIGVYPGASSSDVEEQLTSAVEKYLYGFSEINKKKTYSVSRNGAMIVFVELNDNVKNSDEFWSKLNHGLNLFKNQLPSGVLALFTDSDFGDTSALLITLESDQRSYRELETYLNQLEDRLRRIESVSKVRHYGLQKEEISIYLEPEKLTNYGINSSAILANLFTQGFTTSAGTVESENNIVPIHISESYSSEKDIAEQIIYSDPQGNIIRLKDVARIVREYPEPESYIASNGEKCLLISMEMQEGNNIVQYGKEVDEVLHDFKKDLPPDVNISRIADQPKVVADSISSFLLEFFIAIAAVILVTMLLLPFRVASVAAASIPISIFASLGIMFLTGIELNTVTLAALIVVLGMIVDNSVVIVDCYIDKLDHGFSRWHSAISSAKMFSKAIFSATLAISITFFPFLFTLKGTFNDFVRLFPWTVTITLGISLLVAMLVIPYLQFIFIKRGFHQTKAESPKKRHSILDIIQSWYERWLDRAFRYPRLTVFIGIAAVVVGSLLFTQIPLRLMPIAERNQFAVEIYLPQGSSLEQTASVADSLEVILKADRRVKSVTSFIGTSSPRFHVTYAPKLPGKNYAQFIVNTVSIEATEEMLDEYPGKYANYFPNAYARFKQLDYQVTEAPIEVRVSGDNVTEIKTVADSLAEQIKKVKGICWVRNNYEGMLPVVDVSIDPVEANRLGINKTTVAANLAMHFNGLPVTTLWEDDYPLPVKLRTNDQTKNTLEDIEKEYVHSVVPGVTVPLRQVASVTPDWQQGQYVRRNGVRTITVLADVEKSKNVNKIFPAIRKITETTAVPEDIRIEFGGAREKDLETIPQIIAGLLMSIMIIFLILIFHFRKIRLALLVLLSSSLTLLGATIGGIILDIDFGITSILGIVSLIGILVRNGIIMIDYAEELRATHKLTVLEAITEAGKRRMRPIFLTSAAASVGVIPMIVSKSALWAPMGTVICFGTMVSMVLLVFVLPVLYWMLFRKSPVQVARVKSNNSRRNIPKVMLLSAILLIGTRGVTSAQNQYSLEQCLNMAVENNTQIKNAALEVDASKQVKRAAFTKFFPTVEATGMYFKARDPLLEFNIEGGNLPVYDGNPVNLLTATQFAFFPGINLSFMEEGGLGIVTAVEPVFAGGRIINGNRLASLGVRANNSKLTLTRNEVLIKTEEQYWQVVSLKEKMKTLNLVISLLDTLQMQANDAYEVGLINRNDVMKVMLKQNDFKVSKLQLENGIKLATMALCQQIGVAYDSTIILTDSLVAIEPPALSYVNTDQALQSREEYKLLEYSVDAERLKTQMKVGEYLPEIAVGVGGYYTDIMDDDLKSNIMFATVSIPISGWWEASHTVKEQRIRREIAENNQQNTKELLSLQIQKVWNELDESYERIHVAKESIRQADENLKINSDNYNAGMVNISDMIEAQMLLQQARNQLTDAETTYRIKWVNYQQVTGRYR